MFKGQIVLIGGAPCSGKGTQCKLLSRSTGMVHISAGDLCREKSTCNDELGIQVKRFIDAKELVPDELFISLLKERISRPDAQAHGVLLDGFPRTGPQVQYLINGIKIKKNKKKKKVKIGGMILLHVEDEVLKSRAKDRRVDPLTGDIFNLSFNPCHNAEISSRLIPRKHDADPVAFGRRIIAWDQYFAHIDAELTKYGVKKVEVNGNGAIDEVNAKVSEALSCLANNTTFVSSSTPSGAADIVVKEEVTANVANDDGWGETAGEANDNDGLADPTILVTPCQNIDTERTVPSTVNVCVSIDVPDLSPGMERAPCDIVCVVDVSGSMNADAAVERPDGTFDNSNGLNVLNLVQHSIKSVMHMIGDNDRLAIVTFNFRGSRVLELTHMTEAGRATATEALYNIQASGQTNIWDGVYQGMEVLRGVDAPEPEPGSTLNNHRSKTMLLLTDGQPNIVPPRGIITELRDYKDTNDFEFQINTFGFGYNLKSDMLLEIAEECNGTFAFIPDAVIVGTTFVDCVSNVLNTKAQQATVNLVLKNGSKFAGASFGNQLHETDETWGKQVALGPLQVMQRRTLVVPITLPPATANGGGGGSSLSSATRVDEILPYLEASVTFKLPNGNTRTVECVGSRRSTSYEAILSEARASSVKDGLEAIRLAIADQLDAAGQLVQTRADELKLKMAPLSLTDDISVSTKDAYTALTNDVDGRILKALNGAARFNRWGKHYLRAVIRAHQVELCTNFMDPGVQSYGLQSDHFKSYRAAGDQVFLKLPMVKPSTVNHAPRNTNRDPAGAPPRPPSPVDNSQYYCSGGGCIGGSSPIGVVQMPHILASEKESKGHQVFELNGNRVIFKPAREVKSNDHVLVFQEDKGEISTAQVKCVVKTMLSKDKDMFTFGKEPIGLSITSGHPMLINGVWKKPRELSCSKYDVTIDKKPGETVFNFILNQVHKLVIPVDAFFEQRFQDDQFQVEETLSKQFVAVATLGHGILNDPVVTHPYLGDMSLVETDLSKLDGWSNGEVMVKQMYRDITTNKIVAMR